MSRHLFSAGLFACVLLFSGCDSVNTALNDALPEINVGNGVLGLDGEAGTEVSGEFVASKTASATARFSLNKTFDDLETGDITALTNLSTDLILAAGTSGQLITINRESAASLPDQIVITGGTIEIALTDDLSSFTLDTTTFPAVGTLTRQSGCAADAQSCGYIPSGTVNAVLASYVLSQAQATEILTVIRESTPPTPNTIALTLDLSVSDTSLAGTSATLRIGESNTTVQAEIF